MANATIAKGKTQSGSFQAKLKAMESGGAATKMNTKAKLFFLQNLGSLLVNGLSLPRSLALMSNERSLKKFSKMINTIRKKVETGETLSSALACFPSTFDKIMVHEIRTAEQAGTAGETLERVAHQLERQLEVKADITKKLSYPVMVLFAGSGAVVFMMFFVVPTFRETFEKSGIPLPLSTMTLIGATDLVMNYGWMVLLGVIGTLIAFFRARKVPHLAYKMDAFFLQIPWVGTLLKEIAVLQFISIVGRMMNSGFKLVEALGVSVDGISNHVMRRAVVNLKQAVTRGERLSVELEKYEELFPAVISQLVIVGEQTGNLAQATECVERHLSKTITRKIDKMVAGIEPAMTIGMVFAVGLVMLAIYEPMFAMLETIE